jgi:hypothetical protein
LTGLDLVRTNEVGDPGVIGRYRGGIPIPYGAARIEVPSNVLSDQTILWLAKKLSSQIDMLRKCGAEDIHFSIALYHDGQCNWALTAEELKALASLGIYITVSAYQDDSTE